MESQWPSTPFSMQQGFDLSHELPLFGPHASWNTVDLAYRSREPSVIATEPPKYPNHEDWESIRPVFTKLYSSENRSLKEAKRTLERDHGFIATYGPMRQLLISLAADFFVTVNACTKLEQKPGTYAKT